VVTLLKPGSPEIRNLNRDVKEKIQINKRMKESGSIMRGWCMATDSRKVADGTSKES